MVANLLGRFPYHDVVDRTRLSSNDGADSYDIYDMQTQFEAAIRFEIGGLNSSVELFLFLTLVTIS